MKDESEQAVLTQDERPDQVIQTSPDTLHEESDHVFNLELSPEQVKDIVEMLEVRLRQTQLRQTYANRLHDMYVKLTGNHHEVWHRLNGQYYPDDK